MAQQHLSCWSTEAAVDILLSIKRIVAGFPLRRPGFASGQHVGFVGYKAALGQVFPANHSTNFSIIIITRGWHNRPISDRSAEWTQLDSTPHYTNLIYPPVSSPRKESILSMPNSGHRVQIFHSAWLELMDIWSQNLPSSPYSIMAKTLSRAETRSGAHGYPVVVQELGATGGHLPKSIWNTEHIKCLHTIVFLAL
jgi:hypothetical protein